jgi:hypothetical protein
MSYKISLGFFKGGKKISLLQEGKEKKEGRRS